MENDNLDVWESIFKNQEWGKYPPVALIKTIARNFYKASNRRDIKILEIGSGPGANLWYLAREGFSIYGIDGSKTACEKAVDRLVSENLQPMIGEILVGDYYDRLNDFEDGFFDAVIDVESLYCNSFEKSKKIVDLAFQKIKVGGVMLSISFAEGTWGVNESLDENDYHSCNPTVGPLANTGYGRYVTRDDIEKLYKLKNNEITSVERQDLYLANNEVIKEWIIELRKV